MIELKSDYLQVEFQSLGGALSSIKDKDGVEYLWQGDPAYWSGQAPVLFPICGSVRNDTVLYDKEDGSQVKGKIPRHCLVPLSFSFRNYLYSDWENHTYTV